MSLAPNQQQLFLREWNHQLEIGSFQVSSIDISDIKYLVTGNACLHVKEHRLNISLDFLKLKSFHGRITAAEGFLFQFIFILF